MPMTLHERVGDQENLRGLVEPQAYVNGAWGRVFGVLVDNRWSGPAEARAEGNLVGFQTGLDLFRRTTDSGRRDHVGLLYRLRRIDARPCKGDMGPGGGPLADRWCVGRGLLDAFRPDRLVCRYGLAAELVRHRGDVPLWLHALDPDDRIHGVV
jgi:hypothetical protein